MTDTTGPRMFELFAEAQGLEATARAAFLRELERTEPDTARELSSLLASDESRSGLPTDPDSTGGPGTLAREALEATRPGAPGAALARVAALSPPPERFEVLEELGHGAMGRVTRVHDRSLGRDLARKALRPDKDTGLGRFLDEARVLGRLDHPGIVPIHDLGVDAEGHAYFTMPVVQGGDLRAAFAKARAGEDGWSLPRVVGVLQRVCEAMAYAHAKGTSSTATSSRPTSWSGASARCR